MNVRKPLLRALALALLCAALVLGSFGATPARADIVTYSDGTITVNDAESLGLNRYQPLEVTGTAQPGKDFNAYLLLYNIEDAHNERQLRSITADEEGNWSLTISYDDLRALTGGSDSTEHGLIFVYTAMNREAVDYGESYNARVTFTVDHTEVHGVNAAPLIEGDRKITGATDPGAQLSISQGDATTDIIPDESGAFTYQLAVPAHAGDSYTLTSTDTYGKTSTLEVTAEAQTGRVTLYLDEPTITGPSAVFTGVGMVGYAVELTVDGQCVGVVPVGESADVDMDAPVTDIGFSYADAPAVSADGRFTFNVTNIPNGAHTFGARYADEYFRSADYEGQALSIERSIDAQVPVITVTEPLRDIDGRIRFTLSENAYTEIRADDQVIAEEFYRPTGENEVEAALRGVGSVTITARDDAGNVGAATVDVTATPDAMGWIYSPDNQKELRASSRVTFTGWMVVAPDAETPDSAIYYNDAAGVTYTGETTIAQETNAANVAAAIDKFAGSMLTDGARVYRVSSAIDLSGANTGVGMAYLSDTLGGQPMGTSTYTMIEGGSFVDEFIDKAFGGTMQDKMSAWQFWTVVALGLVILFLIVWFATAPLRKRKGRHDEPPKFDSVNSGRVFQQPGMGPGPQGMPQNPQMPGQPAQGMAQNPQMPGQPAQGMPQNPQMGVRPPQGMPQNFQQSGNMPRPQQGMPQNWPQGAKPGQTPNGQPIQGQSWQSAVAQNQAPHVPVQPTPVPAAAPISQAENGGTVRLNTKKALELKILEERAFAGVRNERTAKITDKLLMGRVDTCDFPIHDETVSSDHALLTLDHDKLYITDHGSTNKTKLGDEELAPNMRVPLPSGSKLTLGRTTLTITY